MHNPELHDPEVLAYATRIAAKVLKLSPVAAHAMELVVDRYLLGQERYGAPDIEGRDWVDELQQEVIDKPAYEGLLLVAARDRRMRRSSVAIDLGVNGVVRIPAPPFDEDEFDLSDADESIESAVVAHVEAGR